MLAPGEQIWADVGQIIRNRIPDRDGNTIPADVMMGSYELRDLDHLSGGSLYEGKLVLDKTWGHGYYGCTICCGYRTSKLNPNPFSGLIGTGGSDQAQAEDCSNTWWDFTDIATNWASSNTGVATVASAYTNLVGVGHGSASAALQLEGTNYRVNCPLVAFAPQSAVTVTPRILFNGKDVTSQTTQVIIGEQIPLTASYILPGGVSVQSQSWTVPGNPVSGFTASNSAGSYPSLSNTTSGSVTF